MANAASSPVAPARPRARGMLWVAWGVALVYIVAHLALYVAAPMLDLGPEMTEGMGIAVDWRVYQNAGCAQANHTPIYPSGAWSDYSNFRYHPVIALAVSPLCAVDPAGPYTIVVIGLVLAYLAGLALWARVAAACGFPARTLETIQNLLPLAAVASAFLANTAYGNIGPALVPLSGALVLALLRKQSVPAGLLTALIVLFKPQWAFALVLPIALGEWRLLGRTLLVAVAAYAAVSGVYVVLSGPAYGLDMLRSYVTFMAGISANYPWRGSEAMFQTVEHGIYPTLLRYADFQVWVRPAADALKVLLTGIVAWQFLRAWRVRARLDPARYLQAALVLVLLTYVLGMLLLDQLEEALLAGVVFAYVIAIAGTWGDRMSRLIALPVIFYLLFEIPMLLSIVTEIWWLALHEIIPQTLIALLLLLWALVRLLGRLLANPGRVPAAQAAST